MTPHLRSVIRAVREVADRENPGHDTCPICRAWMDTVLYGEGQLKIEHALRRELLCKSHRADHDAIWRDMARYVRENRK